MKSVGGLKTVVPQFGLVTEQPEQVGVGDDVGVALAVGVGVASVWRQLAPAVGIRNSSHHPRRSFRCRSRLPCGKSGVGRVGDAGGCPTVRARIVFPAGVQKSRRTINPPQTIISLPVQTAV